MLFCHKIVLLSHVYNFCHITRDIFTRQRTVGHLYVLRACCFTLSFGKATVSEPTLCSISRLLSHNAVQPASCRSSGRQVLRRSELRLRLRWARVGRLAFQLHDRCIVPVGGSSATGVHLTRTMTDRLCRSESKDEPRGHYLHLPSPRKELPFRPY